MRKKIQFGDLIFSFNFHTFCAGFIKIVETLMKISFPREANLKNELSCEKKKVEDFLFPFKSSLNPCFDLRNVKKLVKNGDRPLHN